MEILLQETVQAATINIRVSDKFKMKMTLMFLIRTKRHSIDHEWAYPQTVIMAVPGLYQDFKSTVKI